MAGLAKTSGSNEGENWLVFYKKHIGKVRLTYDDERYVQALQPHLRLCQQETVSQTKLPFQ